MRRVLWATALTMSALSLSWGANPPSILNNSTHEVYQDSTNFAALGITCTAGPTDSCSYVGPATGSTLAISQTGQGVNLIEVSAQDLITYATTLAPTNVYAVEGTTLLTPAVPYQVIGNSTSGYSLLMDQTLYPQLLSNGIVYSYAYCGHPFPGDYPSIVMSTVLPNNASGLCHTAQGIEFSINVGSGTTWTPISSILGSMIVDSPSASQNALQVVLSAIKLNNPSDNWFDVKAALRQNASNWPTGYAASATNGGAVGFGYGNINYPAANTSAASPSTLFLQPPGITAKATGIFATITLYPYRQTRRAYEVVYSVNASYAWPIKNEYTTADIVASGSTLIYTSNGTDVSPTFTYTASMTGTITFIAFTTDGAGHYSRVESFSPVAASLMAGSSCFNL